MGEPPVGRNPRTKRFSGRDYHSQDTSGPFEPPDISSQTSSEGRRRAERKEDFQTLSERPQTAAGNHTDSWHPRDGGALKRRTSWDGSPVVQPNLPAPFDGGLDIDSEAISLAKYDSNPPINPFESVAEQGTVPHNSSNDSKYQRPDGTLHAIDRTFAAPEAPEDYWPPELPLASRHIQFDDVATTESRRTNENGIHEAILVDPFENKHIKPDHQSTEQSDYDWTLIESDAPQAPTHANDHVPETDYQPPAPAKEYVDPFALPPAEVITEETKWDGIPIDPFPSSVPEERVEQPEETLLQLDDEAVSAIPSEQLQQITEEPIPDLLVSTDDAPAENAQLDTSVDHNAGDGFAKLLRRLRRKMDEILEKRTSWQNEQQKLERRRAFLNASIRGMIEVLEAERAAGEGQGSPTEPKKEKRGRGRRRTIPDLSSPRTDGLQSSSASAQESHAASASEVAETAATSISFSNFAEAQTQVKEDEDRVNEQENRMKQLVEQINNLEFHVQELVRLITKQMSSETFIDELRLDMLNLEATTQASEPDVEPEDDTPEVVRKYFDWTGERGIQLERLQELDYDHNESLVEREVLRDQGKEPDVSNEEHSYLYHSHRTDITTRLDEAGERITFFYQLCQDAGIDPEQYRKVRRTAYSDSASRQSHSVQSDAERESLINENGLVRRRSLSPPEEGHKLAHIEAWRHAIPPPASDMGSDMPPNHEQPPSKAP